MLGFIFFSTDFSSGFRKGEEIKDWHLMAFATPRSNTVVVLGLTHDTSSCIVISDKEHRYFDVVSSF